jgi:hypothetical protein
MICRYIPESSVCFALSHCQISFMYGIYTRLELASVMTFMNMINLYCLCIGDFKTPGTTGLVAGF